MERCGTIFFNVGEGLNFIALNIVSQKAKITFSDANQIVNICLRALKLGV